ncbi:MAG TPA: HAD family hydrolase [Candidatus Pacearchaeota archaeon]|nr:HAD family hydrolase [Candidatus Pacearchaeota archaeon]HOK93935.1 HAD family hydrolase [Candidatus Pacearchaeota archaeon]
MLKLILFDFYKTLGFDSYKAPREEFFSLYRKLGIELTTPEKLKEFNKIFGKLVGFSKDWLEFSQKLLKELKIPDLKKKVKVLADFYQKNLTYELYDDVREVINLPFKKGILTSQARFLIEHLQLEKWARLFTPLETKFLKPDPRAFLVPLKEFKVGPEETLMVGDELERDIKPAQNLGMKTMLIDRDNSAKINNLSVPIIHSLRELRNLLTSKELIS